MVIACLDEGSNPSGSTTKRNLVALLNTKNLPSLLEQVFCFGSARATRHGKLHL